MSKRKTPDNTNQTEKRGEERSPPPRRSKRLRAEVDYSEKSLSDLQLSFSSNDEDHEGKEETSLEVTEEENEDGNTISIINLNVQRYRRLLVAHDKKLYKDPPVLPPLSCTIFKWRAPPPKRNKKNEFVFADFPKFRPNLSPSEVLQNGSFGGTYFRTIESGVMNRQISSAEATEDIPSFWLDGLKKSSYASPTYNASVNKYGVKCGGDLGMWESSGWISPIDPYGWFQWYCRFFQGRRSSDDDRQVSRALGVMGPKGRFRNQLLNKICAAHTHCDDYNISPVIRQSLQHWALAVTQHMVDKQSKMKGYA